MTSLTTTIHLKSNIPIQKTSIKSYLDTISITMEFKEKFTVCIIYYLN